MVRRLILRIQNYPIRFKLLGSYLLIAVIFAASIYTLYTQVQQVFLINLQNNLQDTNALLRNMVHASAGASVRNYLRAVAEKNRDIVNAFYAEYQSGRLTEPEAKKQASALLLKQSIGKTGYLYCLNSRGVLEVHPVKELREADISQYDFVREQIQRKEGYLEYEWQNPGEAAPRPKALYMVYFAPWDWIISASSYREEFASLVNLDDFKDHFLSVKFGDSGYPYVIDTQGTLIIHPKQQGANILASKDSSGRLFIQEMIAAKNGVMYYPWQNPDERAPREKLVYFSYIPEMDWIVATSSYVEEFYRPLNSILWTIAITLVIALVLVLALTLTVSTFITRPLQELIGCFDRGAAGDLSVRIPVQSTDEIGRMGRYFNAFMERLQTYQEHLEDRVQERTQQLAENERIFRSLFELSPVGMSVTDLGGRYVRVNPAMCRLMGYSEEELLQKTFIELSYPDEAELKLNRDLRAQIIRGETDHIEMEKRFVAKNGQTIATLVKVIAERDLEGKAQQFIGQVVDISEHKRIEQELLRAKEAAEAATRLKSDFLANMSHEIRTPMNAIIGMTSLLLDTPLTAEQHNFVEVVRTSSDTLLTLINDILDFSKIEAGKMELEAAPFDLRTCIEETLDLLSVRASQKKLELAYLMEPDTPSYIVGDVTRLRQILVNLLNNAVKFTEAGEVVVSVAADPATAHIEKEPTKALYQLHFKVRDTGIGIPPEKIGRLFQSFSQLDASTTRKYGGTGLGLTISKRLCELMGGEMWVESTGIPGQGATFHFTVRVTACEDRRTLAYGIERAELSSKRVLVVDDNETNRLILDRYLRAWKMEVVTVESGRQALDLLAQKVSTSEAFDLALLDMQMPEMDGVLLAQEIRRRLPVRALPLVLITSLGYGKTEDSAGLFQEYLHKPLKPSLLYDALVKVFTGQKVARLEARTSDLKYDTEMAVRHPLRILLAEDNKINQQVALRFLQRLGYRADTAANGLEALAALRRQPYDVVFLDVNMPEMDGLEAAQCICREWPAERRPRLIAMTANAMHDDRDQCLAAGMVDYVSKPINMHELIRALNEAGSLAHKEAEITLPATAIDHAILAGFVETMGEDLAPTLLGTFLESSQEQMNTLESALAAHDAVLFTRTAHTLKSNCAMLGATALAQLCRDLEQLGKAGELLAAQTTLQQAQSEYVRARQALEKALSTKS